MFTTTKFDRLTLFSFAWAFATVMHILSFPERLVLTNVFTWLTSFFAVLVIFRPASVSLFMIMLTCSIVKTFQWMPFTPNHIFFECIINLGILLTFVAVFLKTKKDQRRGYADQVGQRVLFFNSFAPFVRISLLVLYFFAVLHKLNWDYFNPDISCGPFLLEGFAERLPVSMAENSIIRSAAVWGSLLIEAAIPLLFLFRKTRSLGIFIGLGFHYFLAVHPHNGLYSFSSMLFALYTLFVAPEFPKRLESLALGILGRHWIKTVSATRKFFAVLIGVLFISFLTGFIPSSHATKTGLFLWLIWGLLCMILFTLVSLKFSLIAESFPVSFKLNTAWYALIPLVIIVNGLSPYLGLKTQTSFSMFSNLRTEGGITNHLFLPVSFHLTHYEEDLVEILSTNHEELQEYILHNQLITFFEFHRTVSTTAGDFYVVYKRNGREEKLVVKNGSSSNAALAKPINYLAYKFIRFRPIDKGVCTCKH